MIALNRTLQENISANKFCDKKRSARRDLSGKNTSPSFGPPPHTMIDRLDDPVTEREKQRLNVIIEHQHIKV